MGSDQTSEPDIKTYIHNLCYGFLNNINGTIVWLSECHIDGLVQERRNSSALAMELRLSCTNLSI